ncbi:biogenesis of lysosome-related organelles complex 1 subunit 2-like [Petaurus breviceps papuanus]|uniref:biogenesis of lysosome-related organelles complex 1 subunit 2-like n=1 Tax=Petaurus breviceps papuanus TaxID=3040969 RepID=UPI0036DB45F2
MAEEATEPAEVDITGLCQDVFSKMAKYLMGELTATSEDYKLLENMNKLLSLKYLEMKATAVNISRNLKDLNQKHATLQPSLDLITLIEKQVAALQQAAYKLDAYSKKLKAEYKKLEGETATEISALQLWMRKANICVPLYNIVEYHYDIIYFSIRAQPFNE